MNRFKRKEFLAWALMMVSVYLLTIFVLVHVMNLDTPKPVVVVVTVVVVETPTPIVTPGPPPTPAVKPCKSAKVSKPPKSKPQTGGYTGTVVEPYSQPAKPVPRHYVKPRQDTKPVHRAVLHKRKHCVHHHRHHKSHHRKCHHHKHRD